MNYFTSPPGEFRTPCSNEFHVEFMSIKTIQLSNYESLINKPTINSVILQGDLTAEDLGLGRVYYDTTENWDHKTDLVSEKGAIYIYSDYIKLEDDSGNITNVAAIRVGDGSSYLKDLPFVASDTSSAINAQVTQEEKDCWNSKVSAYIDDNDPENLILTTDCSIDLTPGYSSLVDYAIVDYSVVGEDQQDEDEFTEQCFTVEDENYVGDVVIYYNNFKGDL